MVWDHEVVGSSPASPTRPSLKLRLAKLCGYRIMAIISGFQPDDAGSIPATRSKKLPIEFGGFLLIA